MPTLHIRYNGDEQASARLMLVGDGPYLQVTVHLAEIFSEQLAKEGKPVPAPVSGYGLIDTGASKTCIDNSVALQMGLPVVDVVKMASATHSDELVNVYPTRIELVGMSIKINSARTLGANLASQGLLLLIGRDVLSDFTLFYNGFHGQITLSH